MPQILVFETTSFFTAELQRRFIGVEDIQVRWIPHLIDLKSRARDADLILFHIEEPNQETLQLLQELSILKQNKWLLLVKDTHPELEWILRELGVDAVLLDTVQKSRLLEVVECLT